MSRLPSHPRSALRDSIRRRACALLAPLLAGLATAVLPPEAVRAQPRSPCDGGDVAACSTSCDHGHAESCTRLGEMYAEGRGVKKNEKLAAESYKKACDLGATWGCGSLGFAYVSGRGVKKDPERAGLLLRRACDGGLAEICTDLGILLADGAEGLAQNLVESVLLFRRSCDLKHPAGCFRLALAYDRGEGVERDQARAISLYQESCDGGFSGACTNLGDAFEHGQGVKQDLARSTALYEKGCEGEDEVGCFCAGEAYVLGRGVKKDLQRGASLYERSCKLGFKDACRRVGVGQTELIGLWSARVESANLEALLFPQGRYVLSLRMEGVDPLKETGRFYLEGDRLALVNATGVKTSYTLTRSPESMTWAGGSGGAQKIALALEKGSRERVTEMGMKMEASAAEEDASWITRIKVGKAIPMPGFSLDGVPRDPNPQKVFRDVSVFEEIELYAHTPERHVLDIFDLERPAASLAITYAYFLPSGRFALVESSEPALSGKGKARTKAVWGAYSVEPDSLIIQIDGRSKTPILAMDGRRTLAWDERLLSLVTPGNAPSDEAPRAPERTVTPRAAGPSPREGAGVASGVEPPPPPPAIPPSTPPPASPGRQKRTVEIEMEEMMEEMKGEIEARRRTR